MRMFRLWCMALCLVFAEASFASAHRVNIFAFVDGDAVQVECGFNRSQKVKQGTVEVFDATTGARLLQGTTDDNGVFRFPVTAELREAGHDLNLRIIAGEGHQNDWREPRSRMRRQSADVRISTAWGGTRSSRRPPEKPY